MGSADLRQAFNAIAVPAYSATVALMHIVRHDDGLEYCVLTFKGTTSSSQPFEIQSELLPPGADLKAAAEALARQIMEDVVSPTIEQQNQKVVRD